jgi:glycosyltransferase involved in cell wall biosynthesis
LKIAIVAPVWLRVPPVSYGGTELVVSLLADRLVERGHQVVLFASGDSITKATLKFIYHEPQSRQIGALLPDILHTGYAYTYCRKNEFDLIHDHTSFSGVILGSFLSIPVLATLHGAFNSENLLFYQTFKDAVYFNAISESQRRSYPKLNYVPTVHNSINLDSYRSKIEKSDFLVFLSRISPEKGVHIAIKVAKRAGEKLVMAGKIDDGEDREYFETQIAPQIDGQQICYLGEVTEEQKRQLMGEAKCLLFPIQWPEPFGLVMLEAMASGTPVVALRNGSVAEVVVDGKTGFVVESWDEMVDSLKHLSEIDPRDCRKHVEENFSPEKMVNGYLKNYEIILEKESEKIAR